MLPSHTTSELTRIGSSRILELLESPSDDQRYEGKLPNGMSPRSLPGTSPKSRTDARTSNHSERKLVNRNLSSDVTPSKPPHLASSRKNERKQSSQSSPRRRQRGGLSGTSFGPIKEEDDNQNPEQKGSKIGREEMRWKA